MDSVHTALLKCFTQICMLSYKSRLSCVNLLFQPMPVTANVYTLKSSEAQILKVSH